LFFKGLIEGYAVNSELLFFNGLVEGFAVSKLRKSFCGELAVSILQRVRRKLKVIH